MEARETGHNVFPAHKMLDFFHLGYGVKKVFL